MVAPEENDPAPVILQRRVDVIEAGGHSLVPVREILLAGHPEKVVDVPQLKLIKAIKLFELVDGLNKNRVFLEGFSFEIRELVPFAIVPKHLVHVGVVDGIEFRPMVATVLGGEGIKVNGLPLNRDSGNFVHDIQVPRGQWSVYVILNDVLSHTVGIVNICTVEIVESTDLKEHILNLLVFRAQLQEELIEGLLLKGVIF